MINRVKLKLDDRLGAYYDRRVLDDGREMVVVPLLTGTARLTIGAEGGCTFDDAW